jgi:hypothetical protein
MAAFVFGIVGAPSWRGGAPRARLPRSFLRCERLSAAAIRPARTHAGGGAFGKHCPSAVHDSLASQGGLQNCRPSSPLQSGVPNRRRTSEGWSSR